MSLENKKTVEVYKMKAKKYLETSIKHDNLDLEKAKHNLFRSITKSIRKSI